MSANTVPCFACEKPMQDISEAHGPYLHEEADIVVLCCATCAADPVRLKWKGLRPLTAQELYDLRDVAGVDALSGANNWRH